MEMNSFLVDTAMRLMIAGYPVPEVRKILTVLNSSSGLQCPVRSPCDFPGEGFSIQQPAQAGDVQD